MVDGSVGMAGQFEPLAAVLAAAPPDADLRVLVAGDEVLDFSDAVAHGSNGAAKMLAARLHAAAGVGGCDNVPALQPIPFK